METELGIVVSARDWAERLNRFTVDHGGARVRTRIMRPEDAVAEDYDVLVVDDVTSFLNRRLIQQVQGQGRFVVGVWDAANNPAGRTYLESLGVDDAIQADASAEEFIRVTSAFGTAQRVAEVISTEPDAPMAASDRGQMIVVGASSGGAGSTEASVAIAAALSTAAHRALLIDGDDVVPSIAQRLGLALHPNLRTSVDALLHQPDRLDRTFQTLRKLPFDTVPGVSNPQDWIELRPGDVVALAQDELHRRRHVVVNISSRIEDLSYHGGAPRYELGRQLMAAADQLVLVSQPTPVGVARALEWVAQARAIAPHRPIHMVLNRSPKSTYKAGELSREITRSYAPFSLVFVPEDKRLAESAWEGEVAKSGPFAKAIGQVVEALNQRAGQRVTS